jgi:hypothetical protein
MKHFAGRPDDTLWRYYGIITTYRHIFIGDKIAGILRFLLVGSWAGRPLVSRPHVIHYHTNGSALKRGHLINQWRKLNPVILFKQNNLKGHSGLSVYLGSVGFGKGRIIRLSFFLFLFPTWSRVQKLTHHVAGGIDIYTTSRKFSAPELLYSVNLAPPEDKLSAD